MYGTVRSVVWELGAGNRPRLPNLSGGYRVPLAPDGLSVIGEPTKVYDGWQYPADWIVEGFVQEGPKILKRGDTYHMVLAEGGTAGPPTGHMIVSARSKSIDGPWENSPYNPIVRTQSAAERWWSKGSCSLVGSAPAPLGSLPRADSCSLAYHPRNPRASSLDQHLDTHFETLKRLSEA